MLFPDLHHVGTGEAPRGKADVLDARSDGVTLRYFISAGTCQIMVTWRPPAPPRDPRDRVAAGCSGAPSAPGRLRLRRQGRDPATRCARPPAAGRQPPPASAPPVRRGGRGCDAARYGTPGGAAAQGQTGRQRSASQFRVYFADYRDVDGLQFPFRIRRATGADTTEETTFDRFRVNPKIDPKKFEVRK